MTIKYLTDEEKNTVVQNLKEMTTNKLEIDLEMFSEGGLTTVTQLIREELIRRYEHNGRQ